MHRPLATRLVSTRTADPQPAAILIEERWKVTGPRGDVITCAVYRDVAPGVEVRVGSSIEHILQIRRTGTIERAREIAAIWLGTAIGKGFMIV
ncbi:MAG TPA: hypothetical protein VFS23_30825 [Vicinamibacterales bacterium]|nr:hypothetical protein [Vicinamibacterales bacterium]